MGLAIRFLLSNGTSPVSVLKLGLCPNLTGGELSVLKRYIGGVDDPSQEVGKLPWVLQAMVVVTDLGSVVVCPLPM